MALYKWGGVWWMKFVVRGIRVRETTSTSSKDLAIQAERTRRRGLERAVNGIAVNRRPKKFLPAASEWIEANEARWSDKYKMIQDGSLKHLGSTFKSKPLSEIAASDVGRCQSKRRKVLLIGRSTSKSRLFA